MVAKIRPPLLFWFPLSKFVYCVCVYHALLLNSMEGLLVDLISSQSQSHLKVLLLTLSSPSRQAGGEE